MQLLNEGLLVQRLNSDSFIVMQCLLFATLVKSSYVCVFRSGFTKNLFLFCSLYIYIYIHIYDVCYSVCT